MSYSIVGGNAAGLFEIDAATGALSYKGTGEDYESGTTSYALTVRASDGSLHADARVTVSVTDVAEAPAFGESSYAFDLAENADGSTTRVALGTVWATDPEGATVSYSIVGGNAAGLFEIDAATGALSYKGTGEDYESGTTSYALTVARERRQPARRREGDGQRHRRGRGAGGRRCGARRRPRLGRHHGAVPAALPGCVARRRRRRGRLLPLHAVGEEECGSRPAPAGLRR